MPHRHVSGGVFELTYESILGDRDKALNALFAWFGKRWRGAVDKDTYEKATSEDLRHLPNYADIERFLQREAPCLLPQLRETTPGRSFNRATCASPWLDATRIAKPKSHRAKAGKP